MIGFYSRFTICRLKIDIDKKLLFRRSPLLNAARVIAAVASSHAFLGTFKSQFKNQKSKIQWHAVDRRKFLSRLKQSASDAGNF
jgi:hypothetical protein